LSLAELITNSKELADLPECQVELVLWPHSTLGLTYKALPEAEVESLTVSQLLCFIKE
jgi:hypothetical protein